jgi:hypothetical protein
MSLSKSLKMDLPALAEMLRSKGRGKDTMLAHITPKEAALLKRRGGSGSVNPDTGLPEFEDSGTYDFSAPAPVSPTYDVVNQQGQFTPTQADTGVPVQVGPSYQPGGDAYAPSVSPAGNAGYDTLTPSGQTVGQTFSTPLQQIVPTGAVSPTITPTSPGVVSPDQQAAAPAKPTDPNAPKDFTEQLKASLTPTNLAKLGLVGGLGLFGASQARKSAAQGQAAQGQEQAIAQPYQSQGQQLIAQAQAGQLNPTSQAALQAARAQSSQAIANRGGVGTEAEANRIATLTQQLLNNQYQYGLQVMQIGDNISLGAIKTGLQLDTQLNTATTNFYTQLAQMVGSNFTPPTVVRTTGTANG